MRVLVFCALGWPDGDVGYGLSVYHRSPFGMDGCVSQPALSVFFLDTIHDLYLQK
jgi:hypothetical protein